MKIIGALVREINLKEVVLEMEATVTRQNQMQSLFLTNTHLTLHG